MTHLFTPKSNFVFVQTQPGMAPKSMRQKMAPIGTRSGMNKVFILLLLASLCVGCQNHSSSRVIVGFGKTGSPELNWKFESTDNGVCKLSTLFDGERVAKEELTKFNCSITTCGSAGKCLREFKTVDCQLCDGKLTLTFSARELEANSEAVFLTISSELGKCHRT